MLLALSPPSAAQYALDVIQPYATTFIPAGHFPPFFPQHTVKGKMGYAPILFRLQPGYSEINLNG